MAKDAAKEIVSELLEMADITVNGRRPWDVQVHNKKLFTRVLQEGTLGLGEAYVEGWWDCDRLDVFVDKVISAGLHNKIKMNKRLLLRLLINKLFNVQTKKRSLQVGERHYDLGNQLFKYMLDSRMNYSCGYWKNAQNLDQAQLAKLHLTCEKLKLEPGMTLLDIGCGWGGLAHYAAENYGVKVVGVTISKQQYDYAKKKNEGLPIEFLLQDYRDVKGHFDRIVSIGMFEHVGYLNYREYMKIVRRSLKEDGIFLLHTIGNNQSSIMGDSWITKYIFPNSMIPSPVQVTESIEDLLTLEDWHNFGADYDKTLMAWHANFKQHWPQLEAEYNDRFYRMWNYYLLTCAGAFRARSLQLWQVALSKNGIRGGYEAPRIINHEKLHVQLEVEGEANK